MFFRLEVKLRCELQDARAVRISDAPEVRAVDALNLLVHRRLPAIINDAEVCVVENVESFRAKLDVDPLCNRRALNKAHVEVEVTRAVHRG